MKKMTVVNLNGTWNVKHEGDEALRILELFGTTMIPTPYLEGTAREVVVEALATRNPGYEVC